MRAETGIKRLLESRGKKYSETLGIRLRTGKSAETFKWFIASILMGARISETLAIRTYRQFEKDGLLSFEKMSRASWDSLVASLDAGGYVRYDFSTADDLIACMKLLKERYDGDLDGLHRQAKDSRDLEARLQEFRGVGPVTTNIFLRDLRGVWKKADPPLGHLAKKAAGELGIRDAKEFWKKNKVRGYDFANFETALMRLGRESRRRKVGAEKILEG